MQPNRPIRVGATHLQLDTPPVSGQYVTLDQEIFYKIAHFDQMPPFFMSLVSASDLWMFISSTGSLSAGRKNPDHALFPYYTDDRIHDGADQTGSKTVVLVTRAGNTFLWEPFSNAFRGSYRISRNLYKNRFGNKLIFEEVNHDLALTFQYAWLSSDASGWIRHAQLTNFNDQPVVIALLDGLQNLLPASVGRRFQLEYSTLVDGYKKSELLPEIGLGLFRLSSIPIDRPEPSESLRANAVWATGLDATTRLISSQQLDAFRRGAIPETETDVRGRRGAYFVYAQLNLLPAETRDWYLVAEVNLDAVDVAALVQRLRTGKNLNQELADEIARDTENLVKLIACADGLQRTADPLTSARHFMNALFNGMRGGIFEENYTVHRADFEKFVRTANHPLAEKYQAFFTRLPESLANADLLQQIRTQAAPALEKLALEYLPLAFSRRHGDPSRPWNIFSIDIKDAAGAKSLNYQGNWRDIFQNWEALALSFPEYVESMITKFVNASTADGYNPYRVTRDGFDWEVIDPHDPWTFIGYWGDHQIIYLLKLLEISANYHPGRLATFLRREIFAYANVPYRIKPYREMLQNPHATINFDAALNREIEQRVAASGNDAKFVPDADGTIHFVNFTEKLLVPVLAKLSNFIPEAGIWLNTQRPEWNDANNALVGSGVSLVTLAYLRRHLHFCRDLFRQAGNSDIRVSREVADWFAQILQIFRQHQPHFSGKMDDATRKHILDALGQAGSDYREKIYPHGFSGDRVALAPTELIAFCELSLAAIDHTLAANRRDDGLFHAYNLIKIFDDKITIRHLYEMLEGQVAILSSGYLSFEAALTVLDALPRSALYRADQNSYLLYPNRELPRFVEKNIIPPAEVEKSQLLQALIATGNREIVARDVAGQVHFNPAFRNVHILNATLERMQSGVHSALVAAEKTLVAEIYEKVFDHQSFTGRSGTFYKYEGLGSIYWHMVSKLALAVSELFWHAEKAGASASIRQRLAEHYYSIREGIGVHKSPARYGAFPTDPYSHTPGGCGVQQPGLTGQVKEDILARFLELGVRVEGGQVQFGGAFLKAAEFGTTAVFEFYDVHGQRNQLELPQRTLAFTFCQVPVVYHQTGAAKIRVTWAHGHSDLPGQRLDAETSQALLQRTGEVRRVDVWLGHL